MLRTRLLAGVAVATALAALVAASPVSAVPPGDLDAEAARMAAPAPAPGPEPAVPTFVNGLSQAVFSTNAADWYSGEVWVQAPFDSDQDGELGPHPRRLQRAEGGPHGRAEGAGRSSRTARTTREPRPNTATGPSTTRSASRRRRARSTPFWAAGNTSPTISTRYESTWVPRGFAVVHAESPGTGHSDGCPTSGGTNETLAAKAVIDWLNGRAPAYTTRTGDTRAFGDMDHRQGRHARHVLQRDDPGGRRDDRRRGARGDRADLGDLRLVRLLPRQRHGAGAALVVEPYGRQQRRSRARTSTCSPTSCTRASTRRASARSAGRRSTTSRRTRIARPATAAALWQERNYMKDVENVAGRDAARPRQQRLQRDDEERGAVLRRAQAAAACRTCSTSTRAATAARRRTCSSTTGSRATSTASRTASRACRARGSSARPRPARRARRR